MYTSLSPTLSTLHTTPFCLCSLLLHPAVYFWTCFVQNLFPPDLFSFVDSVAGVMIKLRAG